MPKRRKNCFKQDLWLRRLLYIRPVKFLVAFPSPVIPLPSTLVLLGRRLLQDLTPLQMKSDKDMF